MHITLTTRLVTNPGRNPLRSWKLTERWLTRKKEEIKETEINTDVTAKNDPPGCKIF